MVSEQDGENASHQPALGLDEARKEFERARTTSGISPKTILDDRTALRQFKDWCHDVRSDPLWDLTNLTNDDVVDFTRWVYQVESHPTKTISYVGEFLTWLNEQEYLNQDVDVHRLEVD